MERHIGRRRGRKRERGGIGWGTEVQECEARRILNRWCCIRLKWKDIA